MKPRGKSKLLIDAMHAQPQKVLWNTDECADAMGIANKSIAAFLAGPMNQGWVFKHKLDGVRVAYSLQPPDEEAEDGEDVPFSCKLYGDGDLDLHGLHETEDGGWRVPAEHAATLRRLLTGETLR